MAFDGFTISTLRNEFDAALTGGIITKITQPESCMIVISWKNGANSGRFLLSADASLPLAYMTDKKYASPVQAPAFCMLLRKHIGSARFTGIEQPDFERILVFHLEHRNELGDLCRKKLIAELMGKHSNIIFTDEDDNIIDSIKRIPSHISSLREVLPGRKYFIPKTSEKLDPQNTSEEQFRHFVLTRSLPVFKAVYTSLNGFSPQMSEELCAMAGVDSLLPADGLDELTKEHLSHTFVSLMSCVARGDYEPAVFSEEGTAREYSVISSSRYADDQKRLFSSVSEMIETFYSEKESYTRIRQKTADLRKIAQTALERCVKKLDLQKKQLKDSEGKDKYRIYGELLNTYGYECREGDRELKAVNYYNGETVTIPLDPTLSASENAKHYFDRYGKLKRTNEALTIQIAETESEIGHLHSILTFLDISGDESDISDIKKELTDAGFIKSHTQQGKRKVPKSRPLHFISHGYDIYVGKNNLQNDHITFQLADPDDWWFHSKSAPGSHVIVKTKDGELPDEVFNDAASLAAWYSSARDSGKVEIDYIQKKYVKKTAGGPPGFVIYHKNYSMMAVPRGEVSS